MRASAQVAGLAFTQDSHIESVLRKVFQFRFDSTESAGGIAREDFRIVKTVQDSHDQDLARRLERANRQILEDQAIMSAPAHLSSMNTTPDDLEQQSGCQR